MPCADRGDGHSDTCCCHGQGGVRVGGGRRRELEIRGNTEKEAAEGCWSLIACKKEIK